MAKKPKINPNRNITRAVVYDTDGKPKSSGWMVRFNRRGKSYQAFFGDSKHGGEKKSLAAARLDRDSKESKFKPLSAAERYSKPSSRNTSGTVGVRWTNRVVKKGKKKYEFTFAIATWSPAPGERRTATFSADKYGKEQAWKLASEARRKGLLEMKRNEKARLSA